MLEIILGMGIIGGCLYMIIDGIIMAYKQFKELKDKRKKS